MMGWLNKTKRVVVMCDVTKYADSVVTGSVLWWQELEIDESMNNKPMPKKQSIQLSECMELFTTNELLGEHDLWY